MSAASILYWRRKGLDARLEPGHWLAFWGACEWLVWMLVWGALLLAGGRLQQMALFSIPQLLVNVVFFFLFLQLSRKSAEPRRWRLTYAIVAIVPVLGWILLIVLSIAAFRMRSMAAFMIAPMLASAAVLLAVAAASLGDVRRRHARHWSHWLGVGAQLFILALTVAMYAYYIVFPPGPSA